MSSANEGPDGKKPSALLDLKATEVKAAAAGSTKAAGASGASAKEDAPKPNEPDKGAGAAPKGSSASGSSDGGGRRPLDGEKSVRTGGFGGVLTHTVAGLVGGLLALLAADTLGPQLGLNGAGRKEATEGLQKRVADVEQKLAAARTADTGPARALAATEKRIGELEGSLQRLAAVESANAKLAEETKALRETIGKVQGGEDPRLTKLQDQLATLAAAAGTDNERRIPQLAAITGKVADLEATIANQLGQIRRTLGQEIDQRLAPVAEASEAARSGTQRIDRDLAALKSEAVRIAERVDTNKVASDRLDEQIRGLDQQVSQLKAALEGQKNALAGELKGVARPADVSSALAPLSQKIGQLETSLKDVVKSEQDRRSSAEQIVLSLELGNLKRAVDRGGSFAKELSDVQNLAGSRLNLAPLAKFRDKGVATTVDLLAEFRSVSNAILDAEGTPADASVVDRLLSGAKSVVRVRKVNHDPNDKSPEAVVGRMEAAVREGRLASVLEEAKALGERAQAAAKPWLEKVEARHAVDKALTEVDKQLKTTIGSAAAPSKGVN